jgi:Fic family protein
MTHELEKLLERAKHVRMSEGDKERQRRSFAYGSAKIENDDITKEIIDEAADRIGRRA